MTMVHAVKYKYIHLYTWMYLLVLYRLEIHVLCIDHATNIIKRNMHNLTIHRQYISECPGETDRWKQKCPFYPD